jgi:hypothetical protein
MIATGAVFLTIVGLNTWNEVSIQYPTQALLAIAAGTEWARKNRCEPVRSAVSHKWH